MMAHMQSELDNLIAILDLEAIEVNIFRGRSPDERRQRIFGGQVAGQALVAAARTLDGDGPARNVHSLHAYFLRPGDPKKPVLYEVDRIRDGRSFTTRRVVAIQHGRAIFQLAASFHLDEPGFEHLAPMPTVADPQTLTPRPWGSGGPAAPSDGSGTAGRSDTPGPPGAAPLTGGREPLRAPRWRGDHRARSPATSATTQAISRAGPPPRRKPGRLRALDLRYVTASTPQHRNKPLPPRQQVWMRAGGTLPDDPLLHQCLLTYASDMTLLDSTLLPHATSVASGNVMLASLDHAMWFHGPFRADEWLLYDQYAPAACGARGLAQGRVFTHDGRLVASVMQEGLIRPLRPR